MPGLPARNTVRYRICGSSCIHPTCSSSCPSSLTTSDSGDRMSAGRLPGMRRNDTGYGMLVLVPICTLIPAICQWTRYWTRCWTIWPSRAWSPERLYLPIPLPADRYVESGSGTGALAEYVFYGNPNQPDCSPGRKLRLQQFAASLVTRAGRHRHHRPSGWYTWKFHAAGYYCVL